MATGSGIYTEEEAVERMKEIRMEISENKRKIFSLKEQHSKKESSLKPVSQDFIRQQLQEFLDLKNYLKPLEFRELIVASIEKIEAKKRSLKHIHFSFIAHLPEDESSNSIPSFIKTSIKDFIIKSNNTIPLILKGLYFKPNHYLFMIRFPLIIRNPRYTCSNNTNRIN